MGTLLRHLLLYVSACLSFKVLCDVLFCRMLLEHKLKKEQERLRKLEQKGTHHGRLKLM